VVEVSDHQICECPNECVLLNIAPVKQPNDLLEMCKKNLVIIDDEHTHKKWGKFLKHKNNMVEQVCEMFNMWKQSGHGVQFVRLDNAGKNFLCRSAVKVQHEHGN
jgi:hypothetical protein